MRISLQAIYFLVVWKIIWDFWDDGKRVLYIHKQKHTPFGVLLQSGAKSYPLQVTATATVSALSVSGSLHFAGRGRTYTLIYVIKCWINLLSRFIYIKCALSFLLCSLCGNVRSIRIQIRCVCSTLAGFLCVGAFFVSVLPFALSFSHHVVFAVSAESASGNNRKKLLCCHQKKKYEWMNMQKCIKCELLCFFATVPASYVRLTPFSALLHFFHHHFCDVTYEKHER